MIDHAGISEQGNVRFRNEDFIASLSPEDPDIARRKGCLFVIADGVGGSGAGDVASREAAQSLLSHYSSSAKRPELALRDAFNRTNLHVYDVGLKSGKFHLETTLSALLLINDKVMIVHVGDSRIYRIRSERTAELLTRDDSEVAELVRMQILTPENARHHPRRHIITRSVGNSPIVRPMFRMETLEAGDIYVLCTDGLWEPLTDQEIAQTVFTSAPEQACQALIALGLERQATDNLSVQVIKVVTVDGKEHSEKASHSPGLRWQERLQRLFGLGKA